MTRNGIALKAAVVVGIVAAFGIGIAVGQQTAPTENQGVKVSPATALDLAGELDSVAGRQLRMRIVSVEPGGHVALHSHSGRPGIAYVAHGAITEHREGSGTMVRHEGDSFTEGTSTVHWAENLGDKPVVIIAVDLFKP